MVKTKICSKCERELFSSTQFFYRDKRVSSGLASICKDCISKKRKKYQVSSKEKIAKRKQVYYNNNRENILEQKKEYHERNKEMIAKSKKEYYTSNQEKISAQKSEYYLSNKEQMLIKNREYYERNKETIGERVKEYRRLNPHIPRASDQRRKALKRELPSTLTYDEWEKTKEYFKGQCSYCGLQEIEHLDKWDEQLHQEHFVPLSEGGEYTHNNIIPSCKSCNSSKGNKNFFEWYPTSEFYSKAREQFILKYLGYEYNNIQQLSTLL